MTLDKQSRVAQRQQRSWVGTAHHCRKVAALHVLHPGVAFDVLDRGLVEGVARVGVFGGVADVDCLVGEVEE